MTGSPAPDPVLRDREEHWPVVGTPRRSEGVFLRLRTDLVQMPDGELAERDVIEHPGAVAVVALDDAGQVLMIRQYRHAAGQLLWEIPGRAAGRAGRGTAGHRRARAAGGNRLPGP